MQTRAWQRNEVRGSAPKERACCWRISPLSLAARMGQKARISTHSDGKVYILVVTEREYADRESTKPRLLSFIRPISKAF